jgi:hypothetical protein
MASNSQPDKFLSCGINPAMNLVGAVLSRRTFAVCSGPGIAGYLSEKADSSRKALAQTANRRQWLHLKFADWKRTKPTSAASRASGQCLREEARP